MVRMSDILKKAKEKEREAKQERQEKPLEPARQEAPAEPVKKVLSPKPKKTYRRREPEPEIEEQKKEKAEVSEVRISPVVMKEAKIASGEEASQLYEEMLSLAREILKEDIDFESFDIQGIVAPIEKIVGQLSLSNEKILELAFIKDSKDESYLLCHSVNVCIFSIEIGLGLGYEKSRLIDLGISAFLHDIGMAGYLHLSNQPRKLTVPEYNKIREHPIKGSETLENIRNLSKIALYVAHQQHERIDGSGYPRGLKEQSINEYARIVGMVDTFEALSHLRAYRNEFLPLEAMREILSYKSAFENRLVKLLIERLGIFPIGALVELNTKEIAQVVRLNRGVPLRPVVRIISEMDGDELKGTKVLDLTAHPAIYIVKGIRKSELFKQPLPEKS